MGAVGGMRVQREMLRRSIVTAPIPRGLRWSVVFVGCHIKEVLKYLSIAPIPPVPLASSKEGGQGQSALFSAASA